AATVKLCRARLAGRTGRAVVINSGNANACTGAQGLQDAERMAQLTGELAGIPPDQVYVSSTGRIGIQLPMDKIEAGIRAAVPALSPEGGTDASLAIMTTDTRPKRITACFEVDGQPVTLAALAKGAGMIEPNMATMLAYLLTDAAVEADALQSCLSAAVETSFNRITVDGDRSTNDTVLFMANGLAGNRPLAPGHPDWKIFEHAVQALTLKLALKMVEDGEGVTKVVTVKVTGARTPQEAETAARSVANSLLVKTSWAGEYPNWGRVMDALGYSKARIEEDKVDIFYDQLPAAKRGLYAGTPIDDLKRVVRQKAFTLTIHLNLGPGETVVYTCNCTEEYVRINM
ncbi:MAG: bifunctional glutamate N-acetyltransferase/amino-acid acetyltransferase ArgJ, partial [Verrucomicrobia bacterium]|nr:bifunctional glutamate N-acetyltransferase/amino-acid acetyltransferase ArgJ [Verrucomicrobiota bacterium]